MRRMEIIFSVLTAATFFVAAKANDAPKRSTELQVLDRFVGNWKTVVTDNGAEITAFSQRQWSQEGKGNFVVETTTTPSTRAENHILWTYDPEGKIYRLAFLSRTSASIIEGNWDDKTQTMKWSYNLHDGNKGAGFHRFIDKDHAEWSLVIKNPIGEVVLEMEAKQSRRE